MGGCNSCCRDTVVSDPADARGPGGPGPSAFEGQGRRLDGGDTATTATAPSTAPSTTSSAAPTAEAAMRRGAAAAAADRRAKESVQGLSDEAAATLKSRRTKDELMGRIEFYYRQAGEEPPFGLAAASVDALRKQLEYAKGLNKSQNAASNILQQS